MVDFTLPRVRAKDAITDGKGLAVNAFVRFWDTVARAIERQERGQAAVLARLDEQQQQLQEQFARIIRQTIATSYANGLTLTASADGATAKVDYSAHVRVYSDLSVPVDGGEITGLDYAKAYFLYYDDPEREGGDVEVFATTNPTVAVASSTYPARHLIGGVTTPGSDLDPPTSGGGTIPPGFPPGEIYNSEVP